MIYTFERERESGIIFVSARLDSEYKFKMVFDTAASRTTFDFNALHVAGYPVKEITETSAIETANGIVKVGVFEVDSISALGQMKSKMRVQVYDFLSHGILSDYEGVLGIDFFDNTKFFVDMTEQTFQFLKQGGYRYTIKICHHCNTTSPANAKFCMECATKL